MLRIAIIGCGHWGMNHVRVFSVLPHTTVAAVVEPDRQRWQSIHEQYPQISMYEQHQTMLEDSDIEAVVIATPTNTHYALVKGALEAGKHVLCEKPLCVDVHDGEELVALARKRGKILMVGHIFLFNSGITKVRELLKENTLGNIHYLSATRTNLGPIRQDVNVVYDLATHDISIFNFLLDSLPFEVSAVGMAFLQQSLQDVAFISLKYPDRIVANIRVSWLDPKKVRQMTIVGDQKMITWDDLADMGPVVLYDKGILKEPYYSDYGEFQLLAREGDAHIPKIPMVEPLKQQNAYFLTCIDQQCIHHSDGATGTDIVRVLSAINESMHSEGRPIPIQYPI